MNSQNILFYSNKCNMCVHLISILQSEKMIDSFNLICIDIIPPQSLPKNLNCVPTAIITKNNLILEKNEIFKWINSVKFLSRENSNVRKRNIEEPIIKKIPDENLIGYNKHEMGEISDRFAYVEKDVAFAHTYMGVKDDSKYAIYTEPEKRKITANEQRALIRKIEMERKSQIK